MIFDARRERFLGFRRFRRRCSSGLCDRGRRTLFCQRGLWRIVAHGADAEGARSCGGCEQLARMSGGEQCDRQLHVSLVDLEVNVSRPNQGHAWNIAAAFQLGAALCEVSFFACGHSLSWSGCVAVEWVARCAMLAHAISSPNREFAHIAGVSFWLKGAALS